MPISSDLFMAILAMDSYNRGYNAGINIVGNQIGDATLSSNADDPDGAARAASFFAQSYQLANGNTVISYRGTDIIPFLTDPFYNLSSWNDVAAWSLWFAGNYNAAQARLAAQFYQQIVASGAGAGENAIITTGHSLGGALAGFVAGIYNSPAVLFDNIGFTKAAQDLYNAITIGVFDEQGFPHLDTEALSFFFGGQTPASPFTFPSTRINGYQVMGDIAAGTRNSTESALLQNVGLGLDTGLSPFSLHKQALLVIGLYAQQQVLGNQWLAANRPLMKALFNDDVGHAAGWQKDVTGNDLAWSQMQNAIAYSAIDEGTRVFGDTGIRAMFNDANDLGSVIGAAGASVTLKAAAEAIAKIFVQFSGQLAKNEVLQSSANVPVTDGVLTVSGDQQTLAVDFSDQLWSEGSSSTTTPDNIVGRKEMTDQVFATFFETFAPTAAGSNNMRTGMKWLWNDDDSRIIDRFVFPTKDDPLSTTLSDRALPGSQKVSAFAAGGSTDAITGSSDRDLIFGGAGDDTLRGGANDDLLAGGNGDDRLIGDGGRDFLVGGDGNDTAVYELVDGHGVSLDLKGAVDTPGSSGEMILEVSSVEGDIDRLVQVEKMTLTDKPDTITVDREALKANVEIDMGGSDRSAAPLQNLDVLDLSGVGEGITYKAGKITVGTGIAADLSAAIFHHDSLKVKNADKIILTNSDDVVKSADVGNMIVTGGGEDKIWVSNGIGITDLSPNDRISIAGVLDLYGGLRHIHKESPWAISWGAIRWGLNGDGELVINAGELGTMYVLNWAGSGGMSAPFEERPGHISVFQYDIGVRRLLDPDKPTNMTQMGVWDLMGAIVQTHFGIKVWHHNDPITLDLDGDGFELTYQSSVSPLFDIDGDRYAERTGWVAADDGLLVRDLNGNNTIDNASEMFGGAQSGYLLLSQLDGNADGKVDASDNGLADFNGDGSIDQNDTIDALKVWRDLDQDAVTDAGELFSLTDLGIASLSVNTTVQTDVSVNGNQIAKTAQFTRVDGSTGTAADVWYQVDNLSTRYTGAPISISAQAEALPEHKAYGTLVSLREAMSLDSSFATLVENTLPGITALDLDALRMQALPILTGWALASPLGDGDNDPNTNPQLLKPHDDMHVLVVDGALGRDEVVDFAYRTTATLYDEYNEPYTIEYWALASGAAVRDANNDVIQHPTLEQVLSSPQPNGAWSTLDGDLIAFVERYIGESLPLDREMPEGTGSISGFTDLFTSVLNTIDLAVVRIATQGGPLSAFFQSIAYDAEANKFHSALGNDQELIPVFESIFDAAVTGNLDATWIAQWKPILDIVIGDFVRGESYLLNTYGFLTHNIVAAYENSGLSLAFTDVTTALGIPSDLIHTGSGTLVGSNDADIFYSGAGNDVLQGGEGPDTYIFGHAIGHDTIDDVEAPLGDQVPDMLRFAQLTPDDITAHRNGTDLVLTVTATGETVTVLGQFTGTQPGLFGGNLLEDKGVGEIIFADGTVWDAIDIAKAVRDPQSTSDAITGTRAIDYLDGGAGNDTLSGGDDGDRYYFGVGYGNDTVEDNQGDILVTSPDLVVFGAGLTEEDIIFSRDGSSNSLEIGIVGTTDTLTIAHQFDASYLGALGVAWFDRIELFAFDDKSFLTWEDVLTNLVALAKTEGNDTIFGFDYQDVLDGGAGNDFLSGGNENDTYIFGFGYGVDVIHESADNLLSGMTDRVVFAGGVTQDDVSWSRDGVSDDLLVTLSSGDTLEVVGQFDASSTGPFGTIWFDRIEGFEFASTGEVLSAEDVMQRILTDSKTSGDDQILGFFREDVLDGGAGNDYLAGGGEGDTYIWDRGYDNDVIFDGNYGIATGSNVDKVVFGQDIAPTDIQVSRQIGNDDLFFTIADTGEVLTIQNQLDKAAVGPNYELIEEFRFSDGTIWTVDGIRPWLIAQASTSGDDTIVGFYTADRLDGGAGDDLLEGQGGGDIYVFGRGYGHDVIDAYIGYVTRNQPDTLEFNADVAANDIALSRSGDDLTLRINGTDDQVTIESQFNGLGYYRIENFVFSDATVWSWQDVQARMLTGTSGDDTLTGYTTADYFDGGAGNDLLQGSGGGDTFAFDLGYGSDVIDAFIGQVYYNQPDWITFGSGLTASALMLSRDGYDLVMSVTGTTDQLRIENQFDYYGYSRIENFTFVDGTHWTWQDVNLSILTASETSGDDTIIGYGTDDTLDGGAGNDILKGRQGNDTYVFGVGYGRDVIDDDNLSAIGNAPDRLVFTAGTSPSDLEFVRVGQDDLVIRIQGTDDEVTIKHHYNAYGQVTNFVFADNTVLSAADVETTINNGGTGHVTHRGTNDAETIVGTGLDDILDGRGGADLLKGDWGSDTYIYQAGSGNDTIEESGIVNDVDKVKLVGLLSADVTLARTGDDLFVTLNASDETLTVREHFASNIFGIEQLVFADDTTWDRATIQAQAWLRGTSGADTIEGTSANETLDGLGGDDLLKGGWGSDTYIYSTGYGNDSIEEYGLVNDVDKVKLVGLNVADVTLGRTGSDLFITLDGTGEVLKIISHFTNNNSGIEQLVFADGTTWDRTTIQAQAWLRGTSGADTIEGTSANETLDGLGGDDLLKGTSGSDTYVYRAGSGSDTIEEYGLVNDVDKIKLVGLNAADVTLAHIGSDLFLTVSATGEVLKVASHFTNNNFGIEQLVFADGTTWDTARIQSEAVITGTAGADTLNGTAANESMLGLGGNDTLNGNGGNDAIDGGDGNDTLDGGAGNDTVVGGAGNDLVNGGADTDTLDGGTGNDTLAGGVGGDTYLYRSGDGTDTINESTEAGVTDALELLDLYTSDVQLRRVGNDLFIKAVATGEEVKVASHFSSTTAGIEQLVFADDTTWNRSEILSAAWIRGTTGTDTLSDTPDPDTFFGDLGNDTINGGTGSDVYVYRSGDGSDYINEQSGSTSDVDTLRFTDLNASDLTFTRSGVNLLIKVNATTQIITVDEQYYSQSANWGVEKIEFANGTSWTLGQIAAAGWYRGTTGADNMTGSAWNDTFFGDVGNDRFSGVGGSDTYVYRSGDGNDIIDDESGSTSEIDILKFTDFNAADLTLTRNGSHLYVDLASTGQRLEIDYQFYSQTANWGVEKFEFADGSNWNLAIINANSWYRGTSGNNTLTGSAWDDHIDGDAGNDTISASSGADVIVGGAGNDSLTGGSGNDTFVFHPNFGQDTITDFASGSGVADVIEFDDEIFASFAAVQAASVQVGADVRIDVDASTSILLKNTVLSNLNQDDFRYV